MTYHEILRSDPATPEAKGIIIAVFDRNATGVLSPFNGMLMIGMHDEPEGIINALGVAKWDSTIAC
ncbi:MAG: hypothetical protein M3297_02035 [Thermoproteota archaeon]|nr:hypothetical protein [Thermoproteota archaeon]